MTMQPSWAPLLGLGYVWHSREHMPDRPMHAPLFCVLLSTSMQASPGFCLPFEEQQWSTLPGTLSAA